MNVQRQPEEKWKYLTGIIKPFNLEWIKCLWTVKLVFSVCCVKWVTAICPQPKTEIIIKDILLL